MSGVGASFDAFAGPYYDDPAAALSLARRDEPVFYSEQLDHWIVTRYADIRRVFADPDRFSASNVLDPLERPCRDALRTLSRHGFAGRPVLANEDKPIHLERRKRLVKPLSHARVLRWEPRVRAVVTTHLNRFIRDGQADLMAQLLWQVPAIIVYSVLGVPDEDMAEALAYAAGLSLFTWGRPSDAEQVHAADLMGRYWQFSGRLVARLAQRGHGDGWIDQALRAQAKSPELFDDRYVRALVMNGSTAGHETVANGAGNAIRSLLEHPASWKAICASGRLIPNAVEECLRYRSPVISWRRRAASPATIDGVLIPAGASVLLVLASGNHDPAKFGDPDRFDIYRRNARRHLSFGYGNHRCIGAQLALLQLRVILEEVTRRLPHLRLAPGQSFDHVPNTSFFGPRELLVEWDPSANPIPADQNLTFPEEKQ